MIGDNILVTPILYENLIQIYPYFPSDTWYDFYTGIQITNKRDLGSTKRVMQDMGGNLPIFFRGGSIISLVNIDKVTRSVRLSNLGSMPYSLHICFDLQENG